MEPDQMWKLIGIGSIVFAACTLVTAFLLWRWNARERRREQAVELMMLMHDWGLGWLASAFLAYAIGNYLGKGSIAQKLYEVARLLGDTSQVAAKGRHFVFSLAKYYREHDQATAAELVAVLQASSDDTKTTK